MNSSGSSLALYHELLPKLKASRRKWQSGDINFELLHHLNEIAIFDCRLLPTAFVDDTGDAVFEELRETGREAHLPFMQCYFEFADEPRMIYAGETLIWGEREISENPQARMSGNGRAVLYDIECFDLGINGAFDGVHSDFCFTFDGNTKRDLEFFTCVNFDDFPTDTPEYWELVGKRVLAIAILLSEELVIDREQRDPVPRISKERKRTQKLPVSGDTHILTINVPIVRYAANRSAPASGGTHEPPALHWRRGHWRVYHRASEHEKDGWVRRCLVGDPAKGYMRRTQYRLVHRPLNFRVIEGGKK